MAKMRKPTEEENKRFQAREFALNVEATVEEGLGHLEQAIDLTEPGAEHLTLEEFYEQLSEFYERYHKFAKHFYR